MSEWLKPVNLSSDLVSLEPLNETHKDQLLEAAKDGELFKLWYTGVPSKKNIDVYIQSALEQQQKNSELPFVVKMNNDKKVIGSTRFCNVDEKNQRLEIGYTWYAQSVQRTSVNTQTKLLLLQHAFEHLKVIAVEFRTHFFNQQSRNAILRLGAKQDGILRNHKIMPDGTLRDTVVYSILNTEWPVVKKHLEFKLSSYQN